MGYYMTGPGYYAGYRGDPGFFSFLKGIGKAAVGAIPVVGPALSGIVEAVGGAKSAIVKRAAPIVAAASPAIRSVKAVVGEHPVLSAAGAAGVAAGAGAMVARRGSKAGAGMAAQGVSVHVGRRHKRMNVCNPRALRRAIRRTHGFAKLAMKTIHLVHPKKHATFGGFRRKRKKR